MQKTPILSPQIQQLRNACTPYGIVASTNTVDNYNRIWARDSVIAGLAGLFVKDKTITEGLKQSLITLQHAQADTGQIPSNVTPSPREDGVDIRPVSPAREALGEVSYGGLVGRIDATTWWIIGVCAYLKHTKDEAKQDDSLNLPEHFYHSIKKAFQVLKCWEMNTRGLLYSPLGGNWADEYVTQGYTLYDNCLYLWALEAAAEVFENQAFYKKSQHLRDLIQTNFYLYEKLTNTPDYHPTARQNTAEKPPYWVAALAPNGYDTRFDMAGNALAVYLNIGQAEITTKNLNNWLTQQAAIQKNWLLPVFYPIIQQSDRDWHLLHNNFAYNFKNHPHHFHNGGCWLVWLGFLGMALRKNAYIATADAIAKQIDTCLSAEKPPYTFHEYWATDTFEPNGTKNLCFSAAGSVFCWQFLQ